MFIEAGDSSEANCIAQDLGVYFNGVDNDIDCLCCGDRWRSAWGSVELPMTWAWGNDTFVFDTVEEYAAYMKKELYSSYTIRLFYKNGEVKTF